MKLQLDEPIRMRMRETSTANFPKAHLPDKGPIKYEIEATAASGRVATQRSESAKISIAWRPARLLTDSVRDPGAATARVDPTVVSPGAISTRIHYAAFVFRGDELVAVRVGVTPTTFEGRSP
jgi:hypothetical protein